MNCSKCNAPIEDGAIFCSECGTPVTAASAPAAPAAPVSPAPAPNPTPVQYNQAPAQPSAFQQNFQNVKNSLSENAVVGGTVEILKSAVTAPVKAANSVFEGKSFLPGIICVCIQFLLVLILFMIKIPGYEVDGFEFGSKFLFALIKGLGLVAILGIEAIGIFMFKDPKKNISLPTYISALGTQTVYPTMIIVVSWLIGLVNHTINSLNDLAAFIIGPKFNASVYEVGIIALALLTGKVIYDNVDGNSDKKIKTTFIVVSISFFVYLLIEMLAAKCLA